MARYPRRSYGRRKNLTRRWIYIISSVLLAVIVVIVFVCLYRSSGERKDETAATSADTIIKDKTAVTAALPPRPEPMGNLLDEMPEPNAEANSQSVSLIAKAMACLQDRPARIIEARDMLNEALPMPMSNRQRAKVKKKLSELAEEWLFSRRIFPEDGLCGSYKVKPGDQLRTIGTQFKVPYEILMEINNIRRPETLQAGETIKVINGPFHTRVYSSTFTMDLYLQNTFVRSFAAGLGRAGRETPRGLWRVKRGGKLIKPVWTDPDTGKTYHPEDPDYPLGSRWIGLEGLKGEAVGRSGIAFHGTKDPNLIGTAGSRGCIRLYNGDVILIYNLLMPGLSQVEVVE